MLGDSHRGSGGFFSARAVLREHGKTRSESGVGGRTTIAAAGTVIDDGDGDRYMSDEFSKRSREVVNPHTWPLRAKIVQIRTGEREPTQNGVLGAGDQPIQANTGVGEERVRSTQARMRNMPPLSTG